MNINLRFEKRHYRLWTVLLSIAAFLFVQAMMLHTHSTKHHHQGSDAVVSGHFHHHSALLFMTDNPGDDHHDLSGKIDPPANGGAKNVKAASILLLALLAVFLLWCSPSLNSHIWHRDFAHVFKKRKLLIRPPLRAPPL